MFLEKIPGAQTKMTLLFLDFSGFFYLKLHSFTKFSSCGRLTARHNYAKLVKHFNNAISTISLNIFIPQVKLHEPNNLFLFSS